MATVTIRGGTSATSGSAAGTTFNITLPSCSSGDLLYLFVANNISTATMTTPSGWTSLTLSPQNVRTDNYGYLFTKTAVGGDSGASVTLTFAAATLASASAVALLATHDTLTGASKSTDGTTLTSPAITPGAADCLELAFISNCTRGGVDTPGVTPATGYTELVDSWSTHATLNNLETAIEYVQLSGQNGTPQSTAVHSVPGNAHSGLMYSVTAVPAAGGPTGISGSESTAITISESSSVSASGNLPDTSDLVTTVDNSYVSWALTDSSSTDPGTPAYLSSATQELVHDAHAVPAYVAYYARQAATTAGAQRIGTTTPSGGMDWALIGIEVQPLPPVTSISGTDSCAITIAETSASSGTMSRTDTAAITIADVSTSSSTLSRTDTAAVTIAETDTTLATQPATDTSAITIAESSSLVILTTLSTTDTPAIAIAETSSVAISLATTDTCAVTISDVSQNRVGSSTSTDTSALSVAESSSLVIQATLSTTDTAAVTITEASAPAVSMSTTDTTAVSVSETSSPAVSLSRTDTTDITVTESRAIADSTPGSDGAGIGVSETTTILITSSTTDTSAISISDVGSTGLAFSSTDTGAISIADVGTVHDVVPGNTFYVYTSGAWVAGTAYIYHNGEWKEMSIYIRRSGSWS